jgi:tetratricopeptide (TPR) repeat protein
VVDERAGKMRRARVLLNLASTSLVATLVVHILELDLGVPRIQVWGGGIGAFAFFMMLFVVAAPVSSEAKLRFWTVFSRTHVSDFIEMATLRSMLLGTFRSVAWLFTVGGVLVMFTPKAKVGLARVDKILDAKFTPKTVQANRALIKKTRERFEADPSSIAACRDLAYIYLRTNRPKDAYETLEAGLGHHPEGGDEGVPSRLDLITLKAIACKPLGRDQEEVDLWRELLRSREEDVEARQNLGIALMRMRNFTEADIELREALKNAVDDLKGFKRDFEITPQSAKTMSDALRAQLEGLKFRAGAAAYQLALATALAGKESESPRHQLLAKQLGYDVSRFPKDVQRFRPPAKPAKPKR